MLVVGIIAGIYSYSILLLGLVERIQFVPIVLVTIPFFSCVLVLFIKFIKKYYYTVRRFSLHEKIIASTFAILTFVNLVGALGPETAFDALWYQLTIPKLFINEGKIFFPTDGLFYYALLPKLGGMLYVSSLIIFNEIAAKLVHFAFGIATSVVVFKIFRIYFERKISMISSLIFYASPVVSWLSITAYVDLIRAFYESLALLFFLIYYKSKNSRYLVISSVMLGLAVSTKVLSLGSLPVFLFGILLLTKTSFRLRILLTLLYSFIVLVIPFPWFLISYFHTGNPIYPLFTDLGLRNFSLELINPLVFAETFINTFVFGADPLHPVYIAILPIVVVSAFKIFKKHPFILAYSIFTYFVWYATSQSGGTRFLTSYIPGYLLLGFLSLRELRVSLIKNVIIVFSYIFCVVTVGYRGIANSIYIPVLLRSQTKEEFLLERLNFNFGDFYDEGGRVKEIVGNETVLLLNMHNLFYVDFPYVLSKEDERWTGKFILIQNGQLPREYKQAKIVYKNSKTFVTLYRL